MREAKPSAEAGAKPPLSRLLDKLYRGGGRKAGSLGALPLFAAAGVGTLMMPDVTLADIIYSGPQTIVVQSTGTGVAFLDLNLNAASIIPSSLPASLGDSINDLRLAVNPGTNNLRITAVPLAGGTSPYYTGYSVLLQDAGGQLANIPYSDSIPGGLTPIFTPGGTLLATNNGATNFGRFTTSNPRGFIGMKVHPKWTGSPAPFHWAWVEVEVDAPNQSITVLGWAFNTEPDAGLHAGIPEPGSGTMTALGMLALGVAGIRRMRRKRKEAEAEAA